MPKRERKRSPSFHRTLRKNRRKARYTELEVGSETGKCHYFWRAPQRGRRQISSSSLRRSFLSRVYARASGEKRRRGKNSERKSRCLKARNNFRKLSHFPVFIVCRLSIAEEPQRKSRSFSLAIPETNWRKLMQSKNYKLRYEFV